MIMEFYIAKDDDGILFFKDCPDLVKYSEDSDIEWTGYPLLFGDFISLKSALSEHEVVKSLIPYSKPIRISIDASTFKVE